MTPEQLLFELETFEVDKATTLPKDLRARLSAAASKVSVALETPTDTTCRVLLTQPVEQVSVRIAADLGIFTALAKGPATTTELARATGAEQELLDHILRSLTAFHAVQQISPGKFSAVPWYAYFQNKPFEDAFGACQDILDKIRHGMPEFLKLTKYRLPTDSKDTVVQFVYDTKGKGYIESLTSNPANIANLRAFGTLMNTFAEGFTQLQEIYPVEELETGFEPSTVMFVDVGGSYGHRTISLKRAHPQLPGRFVVQDLPNVIASAPKDDPSYDRVEMTAYDFMTEQPIKGARCYYLRQVLHDWPDQDCITILRRLKEAAKPGYSRILIHEIIVPAMGYSPWMASQDFTMMCMFAIWERTEADWRELCAKSGLEVSRIFADTSARGEGIIEIRL